MKREQAHRGSQYASDDYRAALTSLGIIASMRRCACCYDDHAVAEIFWHSLKIELIHRH